MTAGCELKYRNMIGHDMVSKTKISFTTRGDNSDWIQLAKITAKDPEGTYAVITQGKGENGREGTVIFIPYLTRSECLTVKRK